MILWMILGHAFSTAGWMEIASYDLWNVTDASLIPEGVHAVIGAEGKIKALGMGHFIPSFLFFFMPWFFYKSGQFFTKRSIREEWSKDWKKLMNQFVFWGIIAYILQLTFSIIDGNLTLRGATYSTIRSLFLQGYLDMNCPLWFLFSLFCVRQIANIVLPQENDKFYWLKCFCVVSVFFLIALGAYYFKFRLLPLWVANTSAGLVFFTLGYSLQKFEAKWWLLVPCVLGYVACCIWGFPGMDMRSNFSGILTKYILFYPSSLAGIVTFNMSCRLVAKYVHYVSLPFEYIGKYAMIIYVSHGLLYTSVQRINSSFDLGLTYSYSLLLILGSYVVFLPLFCRLSKKIHA